MHRGLPWLALALLVLARTARAGAEDGTGKIAEDARTSPGHYDVAIELAFPHLGTVKEPKLETVVVRVHPTWAPIGAARFAELLDDNFLKGLRFFRVVPNFVVQFGIHGNPERSKAWREKTIEDEPIAEGVSNKRRYLTFAKSGPNTRTTQMFINLADNANLDSMGFPPFAEVISGMEFVDGINPEYNETPQQHVIQSEGSRYLKTKFPRLSYVSRVLSRSPPEPGVGGDEL